MFTYLECLALVRRRNNLDGRHGCRLVWGWAEIARLSQSSALDALKLGSGLGAAAIGRGWTAGCGPDPVALPQRGEDNVGIKVNRRSIYQL